MTYCVGDGGAGGHHATELSHVNRSVSVDIPKLEHSIDLLSVEGAPLHHLLLGDLTVAVNVNALESQLKLLHCFPLRAKVQHLKHTHTSSDQLALT